MLNTVNQQLFETFTPIKVNLPYKEGGLIAQFHKIGVVDRGGAYP
jgi:hypothetical protein